MKIRRLGLNIKRYSIAQLKWFAKQEQYREYKTSLMKAIPKRKIEQQWWDIRAKFGYRISKKEFYEFYKDIRKANRKLARLNKNDELIIRRELSTGVSRYRTVAEFRVQQKKVARILLRSYKHFINRKDREHLYENLYGVFGKDEYTYRIVKEFENMIDTEFKRFFEKYPHLERLIYDSLKTLIQYLEKIDASVTLLQTYIETFAREWGITKEIIEGE